MKKKDAELIQRTLDGDQSAFTALVEKYQKGVHALVWQKIGDFHIAQEITQDAFLRAYQKLGTLKNHNLFSGWLYVIATNLCNEWLRKKRLPMQSLETVDSKEVDQVAYTQYIEEQQEVDAKESRRELVRNLLKKLPESERTVITLYYLGEMTCESISEFLGVSQNTIKSRLSRARNRLKKEETMIKENLSSFQLPTQMTENIMREISHLNPLAPSGNKPFIPWAVSAASAVLVLLLIGIGAQHLYQFQKPYSLNAQSEPMIEITETQLIIESPEKPAVRNQVGSSDVVGKKNGEGQKPDAPLFAAASADDAKISKSEPQWVQTKGPEGGAVPTLFSTTRGDVFAGTFSGLYRLTDDGTAWKLVSNIKSPLYNTLGIETMWWPVVERQDTLYLATDTEILVSTDRGETWEVFCECPKGKLLVGMEITDGIPEAQSEMIIYLAYTHGVFRTDNAGISWTPLSKGMKHREIRAIAAIENTVFAGTDKGLYRLNSDTWEQLSINHKDVKGKKLDISALAVAKNHLYVIVNLWQNLRFTTDSIVTVESTDVTVYSQSLIPIYRSTDKGNTWKSITPKKSKDWNKPSHNDAVLLSHIFEELGPSLRIEMSTTHGVVVSGEKIMLMEGDNNIYSIDGGETWTSLKSVDAMGSAIGGVLLNANTFYRCGTQGIHHTTDGGKSWHKFNTGLVNSNVKQLIVVNGILYANTGTGLVSSTDGGESWTSAVKDPGPFTHIMESNKNFFARHDEKENPQFFRLSSEDNNFTQIPGVPDLKGVIPVEKNQLSDEWIEIVNMGGNFFPTSHIANFAVTDTAYYVSYLHRLFRWNIGALNWYDTGIIDINEDTRKKPNSTSFKFAVSGKTVYVGKRDGHLMVSFDEGNVWNDVTANLPFSVKHFNAIIFAGKNVYVATDKGVVRSSNGAGWETITDTAGQHLVVDRFAVDGTTVYATAKRKVYQLKENSGTWQQVTPEIPYPVSCIDVDGNTLYVGTVGRGVLRYSIDDTP